MSRIATRNTIRIFSALGLLACVVFSVYAYQTKLFSSQEALQAYIAGFGSLGALIFVVFQVVQVVVPIIPGGLGCLAGVLLFGAWGGFLYNYIGICIGSVVVFFIARYCGKPILYSMFKEKTIAKYEKITGEGSAFTKWFAAAIFFPMAPDDFLCYLAGTTQMDWKKFTAIIFLGKPASIAIYSLGLNFALQQIIALTR